MRHAGWDLWWHGYQVDHRHWRRQLERYAQEWDSALRKVTGRSDSGRRELNSFALDIISTLRDRPTEDRLLRRIGRALDDNGHESFLAAMLKIASGSFEGHPSWYGINDPDRVDDERALRSGLGFDPVPREPRRKGPPDVLGPRFGVDSSLAEFSGALRGRKMLDEVRKADDEEVRAARDELRTLFAVVVRASEALVREHGSDRRVLGHLGTVATQDRMRIVNMLLVWICVGKESTVRKDARRFLLEVGSATV